MTQPTSPTSVHLPFPSADGHRAGYLGRIVRAGTAGTAAALAVGVSAALAARVLMRMVVLVEGTAPDFSVAGTLGIAVIFVAYLVPGCVACAFSRSWWPWTIVVASGALLSVSAVGTTLDELSGRDLSRPQAVAIVAILAAFAAVFVAESVCAGRLARRLSRRWS